jgi:hypothetical protein
LLASIWCCLLGYVLFEMPNDDARLASSVESPAYAVALLSLFFPAYYMIMSWGLSFHLRPKKNL